MRVHGHAVTKRDSRRAARVLSACRDVGRLQTSHVRRMQPELVTIIAGIRAAARGSTIEQVLGWIVRPSSVPTCVCGDAIITTFNRGTPHMCNLMACPKRNAMRLEAKRAAHTAKHGVTHPMKLARTKRRTRVRLLPCCPMGRILITIPRGREIADTHVHCGYDTFVSESPPPIGLSPGDLSP